MQFSGTSPRLGDDDADEFFDATSPDTPAPINKKNERSRKKIKIIIIIDRNLLFSFFFFKKEIIPRN